MKSIVCESPGRLRFVEREAPRPREGEALVRIHRIGVCGTDLHAYQGQQPFFDYPRVLGHELAAEVVELPPGESSLAVGDRVVILPYLPCGRCIACRRGKPNCCVDLRVLGVHADGGMCEWMSVPVGALVGAPELPWDQAALVECLSIGAHAVGRARLEPEEHVLVIGCGLGDDAEELSRRGFDVTAFDVAPTAIVWCRKRFPESPVNYITADILSPRQEWAHTFDFIFEAYTLQSLPDDLQRVAMSNIARMLAPGGCLLVITRGRDDNEAPAGPPDDGHI